MVEVRWIMILVSILCSVVFTASSTLATERSIRIVAPVIPDNLDPTQAWHQVHYLSLNCVLETLVKIGKTGNVTAGLAKRWSISHDGRTYSFNLDPGYVFHDGTPVTSGDVAYSIARHFWPRSKSFIKESLSGVLAGASGLQQGKIPSGIRTPNLNTITIELSSRYPLFLTILAMPGFGILKNGTGESKSIVGSGSMVASYDTKQKGWSFRAFERFHGQAPGVEAIILQKVDDYREVLAKLRKGAIDLALGFADPQLTGDVIPKGYERYRLNTVGFLHLFMNLETRALANSSYRKDVAALLRYAFRKVADPGFFLEKQVTYLPSGVMPRKYYVNTERLLSPVQFRKKWQHQAISLSPLRIYLRKEYLSPLILPIVEKSLSEAGVSASVKQGYISELFPHLHEKSYDIIMMGYFGIAPDPDGFLDPLNENSVPRYGVMPTKKLFDELKRVQKDESKDARLNQYADLLGAFEKENYLVPLYRLYFPVIRSTELILPDTSFRSELDITRIERKRDL